ncbi:hypothetical protein HRbin19_00575 [bacterium HR19]|nr:hypothetical protein HRbin19_00575 [bacterium HR19]
MSTLKDIFKSRLKEFGYILVFSFLYSLVVFGVFMFARRFQDPHQKGFFALFPVASILLIFYIWFIFNYIKNRNKVK